ncbi:Uncharacterised protein [[Clostridium] sordellii]|uniref:hypothetical protein n=1 Tax=Paraclostridium sordellii TaxID=1505 RepID=UPI0005E918AF|nr:hypothetical protein [Paeniclostridium sordellii]MBX9180071.1 hypothetical protein [Paeniclostridium sordellii]CEN87492.1 Uncharacterised protein [[Clostridium] sordellii] [Paeniclostridium sordellii]CEO11026.1 Uncharacterised protein [[Clostridium] sordellii] [Paeniclostridium sordellii]CEP84125.1 Uncharacterised protein [[Clostridium] sordellii] [Paeniclostridium sordellii]
MKRLVPVLFVLSGVLFVSNPILKSSFANNDSNSNNSILINSTKDLNNDKSNESLEPVNSVENTISKNNNSSQSTEIKEASNNNIHNENKPNKEIKQESDINKNLNNDIKPKENINKNLDTDITNQQNKENEVTNKENPSNENNVTVKSLTMEDALKLLNEMNPNLTYEYKGDENTFTTLKDKSLSGYVFLPNIDTDLGYFVDKNTSSIYYFHPSGYLEKIK